ncbi:hypothetical protein AKJ16_DCAP14568 [Drosera capensis]
MILQLTTQITINQNHIKTLSNQYRRKTVARVPLALPWSLELPFFSAAAVNTANTAAADGSASTVIDLVCVAKED